ncbi:MAG: Glutamyl-tRNA synthetase @ Glutamyl-tRNA(Gln) synthetase [uncultured Acidimicrobiales bacterium]|uniref:Glutamate--tRNA ligase n=1 Tax=uncultured Acidimicrobiales bacterium TaxID=310071 RepID=A0A6J4I451_9ACTN|nr:MAG: Glutamyl-tRNA synthetase @ Glutamyl-tRNA(Gln) synthetase [uncultured Acidimicrobiales bacterium]
MPVRVRFAPSPTGFLHVGGVRTALYNWVVARQAGGAFVLRIEDTDEARNREEWVTGIDEAMRWVGLDWDERHRQSERADRHAAAAERLAAAGRTYWCDCAREEVDARARERGGPPGYDGHCRDLGKGPGGDAALRFRTPDEGTTTVVDVVRGEPAFPNAGIEDFVVVRSNGKVMFVLANVVDDIEMGITHVIRAEEHLPTTPKYLLLWEALGGGAPPVFAHLPVIVNEKRQKLSKRRDPVALELYRDEGYLPEVMLNYLALIGWSPPDGRERFTLAEMVAEFRLEDVGKSPGFFDVAKLRAFNGDAIRALPVEEFTARCQPWLTGPLAPWPPEAYDEQVFAAMAPLVQERVAVLSEVPAMVDFLLLSDVRVDEDDWARAAKPEAVAPLLDRVLEAWAEVPWEHVADEREPLKDSLFAIGDELGLNRKRAQAPVRAAVTGRSVGPPLFESLVVLGRERTLDRLRAARARL